MAASLQLTVAKDVYILSSESDNFDRHGQSYIGKIKYLIPQSLTISNCITNYRPVV